jgi:hypothetical protein
MFASVHTNGAVSLNSNVKQKNDKVRDQNKINIEITNEKQNGGNTSHNNSKIEEKQKKFGLSMKRLVKRMEGSMSTDLRSKMLATRHFSVLHLNLMKILMRFVHF